MIYRRRWVPAALFGLCLGSTTPSYSCPFASDEPASERQKPRAEGATAAPPAQAAVNPQAGDQGAPQGPAPVPPTQGQQRPHLIELSSKNWRPLLVSEKFELFWRDLISPAVHFSLAADAAISFATDDRNYLGDGAKGYFRRYGFNVADEADATFLQAFLLPVIFHEDPRYIPLEQGAARRRAAYALKRIAVTRSDSGAATLNKSLILGVFASSAISNVYNSPAERNTSFSATVTRAAISMGSDAGFNLLKEFWPDFARKVKLSIWMRNIVRSSIRDVIRVD